MHIDDSAVTSVVKEITSKYYSLCKIVDRPSEYSLFGERIVLEILRKFLSPSIGINTGFVKSSTANEVSKSLDMIIMNNVNPFSTYYRDNDLVVARNDAVVGAIDIQPRLTKNSLNDVFSNLSSLKKVDTRMKYWALFFTTSSKNEDKIGDWLAETIRIPHDLEYLPDRISILNYGTCNVQDVAGGKGLTLSRPHQDGNENIKNIILCDFIMSIIRSCSMVGEVYEDVLGFAEWNKIGTLMFGNLA